MGEIADSMIEGDLCCQCGCVLTCEGFGIPILCHSCHSQYQKSCKTPSDGKKGGIMCENFYE